jgi:probable O-glycosylation ligase (exosortase A-associated)
MRDLALSLIIAALLVLTFRQPAVGAYLWAWLSLMNPHKMTYGFAFTMPFAHLAALATLTALLVTKQRRAPPKSPIFTVQLMFLFWMSVTSFFALAPVQDVVERWIFVMKIHLMLIVTWMLVRDAAQIRILVWIVTMSVAFFGIKGGIYTLLTGGSGRVWGPPGGLLQGNNELAVALVMLMPFLYYLRQTDKRAWVRHALLFSLVCCAFSVLGSQSRGALLALVSMAFFLGLKGKYPIRTSVVLLLLMVVAIGFMPESWTNRMETIGEYQADGSAMSRIWTWKTLYATALDRPLVGAGFRADNLVVFGRYAPTEPPFDVFAGLVFVAHSIYLQVLGEQGFVGLALFLGLGLTTWITASRVARLSKDDPEFKDWMPLLLRMVQVSLIGYAIGGTFLSLAYLDLPYYVIGFVVLCGALVNEKAAALKPGEPRAAAGAGTHPPMPPGARAPTR